MGNHIGKQFGHYRLIQYLGGNIAEVYLGQHVERKTLAAVKLQQQYYQRHYSQALLEHFLNAMETAASLSHPHIVRILDFGISDPGNDQWDIIPYVVMDLAANGTFRQRYAERGSVLTGVAAFPPPAPPFRWGRSTLAPFFVSYVKQIASALSYAHQKQIVHGGIRPENILFGSKGEILLSDFCVQVMYSWSIMLTRRSPESPVPFYYEAPEQAEGPPIPASDQYALGTVVYECLTGSTPFGDPALSKLEIAVKRLQDDPIPLCAKVPHFSPEMEQVVMKALAKKPQDRYPTVEDFALALEGASQE